MNTFIKGGIVIALAAVVGVVLFTKETRKSAQSDQLTVVTPVVMPAATTSPIATAAIPRLVDLGANSCIPCKKMAPILEELRTEYAGRMRVDFIDVWQDPSVGESYGIRLIPTQIFYDASGKELARHEGFMSKEDILAQWVSLGITLAPSSAREE